jgi:hypothetical protein
MTACYVKLVALSRHSPELPLKLELRPASPKQFRTVNGVYAS